MTSIYFTPPFTCASRHVEWPFANIFIIIPLSRRQSFIHSLHSQGHENRCDHREQPRTGSLFHQMHGSRPVEVFPAWIATELPIHELDDHSAYIFTGDYNNISDGLLPIHRKEVEFLKSCQRNTRTRSVNTSRPSAVNSALQRVVRGAVAVRPQG